MLSLFEIAALLLVLSAILSWLNRAYIKLPHTIGLYATRNGRLDLWRPLALSSRPS